MEETTGGAEHTKGARPSTKSNHQEGLSRKGRDAGKYKGYKKPTRKPPEGWKKNAGAAWPPK
jgi:hypothetical protein